jgi:hypothetical protein
MADIQQAPLPQGLFSLNLTLFENDNLEKQRKDYTLKISADWEMPDFSAGMRLNKNRFENFTCKLNTEAKHIFYAMKHDPDAKQFIETIQTTWNELKKVSTFKEELKYAKIDHLKIGRIYESSLDNTGGVIPYFTAIVFQELENNFWCAIMFVEGTAYYYYLNDADLTQKQLDANVIAKLHLSKKKTKAIKADRPKTFAEHAQRAIERNQMVATLKEDDCE